MKSFEERKSAVYERAEVKKKEGAIARRRALTTLSSLFVVAILCLSLTRLPSGNRIDGIPPLDLKNESGKEMSGLPTVTEDLKGEQEGNDPSSGSNITGDDDAIVNVGDVTEGTTERVVIQGVKPTDEGILPPTYSTEASTNEETLSASSTQELTSGELPSTTQATTSPETLTTTEAETSSVTLPSTTSDAFVSEPVSTFEVILGGPDHLTLPADADHIIRIGGSGELVADLIDRFGAPSEGSLPVLCLSSKDELGLFIEALSTKPYRYAFDGIYERVPCYDEPFFETCDLIVVGFTAGSGGDRFALQELGLSRDRLRLVIAQTQSGMTADMADWLLLLAMPKEATESVSLFTAVIADLA